ncbi:hypothetical protein [Deinococcus sp. JMULE3]|uniref:hypothetical protein n=1 Tax=Deinococcus sp. JMULE3 TaxID=2518341 RepID=UPI0015753282|nr:hypothetical protein [Deinococcus sp. JMULE3]NTX99936.1 hypothetical protein [Deinococcus sp. JMULE3]
MRHPPTALRRTPEEVRDIHLSYARPDLRFFSAGACHVLAFAFLERYPRAGFRPRFICPAAGFHGAHVYVSDGRMAFDAQGYVAEDELLGAHRRALQAEQPEWLADVTDVQVPLAEFCAGNNHRAPWDFPGNVWERALAYLQTFPAPV